MNQETCALLCFKAYRCTHWTHNPIQQGGKCWLKTGAAERRSSYERSSWKLGRARSTTGLSSGPKACGGKGFSLPPVSSTTAAANCTSPWTELSSGCYLIGGPNETWYEAKRECKRNGGYLVEIESQEEQDALLAWIWEEVEHVEGVEVLPPHQNPLFWIGLTDVFHDGTWVWDQFGRPLAFSRWEEKEPEDYARWRASSSQGQHCAAINLEREGLWMQVSCDDYRRASYGNYGRYICEAAGKWYSLAFSQ